MGDIKEENISLGGGIQLSGFSKIEPAKLVVVKKMVGNFVKKVAGPQTKKLHLTLKEVHNSKYELRGVLDLDGEIKQSEITDFNLFIVLNKVLEKLK